MKWILVLSLWCCASAWGQVYECKGVYQDIPCQGGKEVNLNENYKPDSNNAVMLPKTDLLHDSRIRSARESRQVVVGMTAQDVRYAWGSPTQINPSFVGGVSHEQWVYRRDNGQSQYIYFAGGKVTAWN